MDIHENGIQKLIQSVLTIYLLVLPINAFAFDNESNTSVINPKVVDKKIAFNLLAGQQYDLCNDLLNYLQQNYSKRSDLEKTIFSAKSSLFSTPVYTPITPENGLRIDMQNFAYSKKEMYGFSGWLKSIERYEKHFKDTRYFETQIDLNNDGKVETVRTSTYFNKKHQFTIYSNFPLNEFGNLNVDWFEKQISSSITNELFLYRGRTFLVGLLLNRLLVQEPNQVQRPNTIGVTITPNICKINL